MNSGGIGIMLFEQVKTLYERFRLAHYRELFGHLREKDGSLSATEAFAADVIYLMGNPTVSRFAEVLGISQPNATYKINNLEAKGYVTRTGSEEDRRECRVSVGERYYRYYDTDISFVAPVLAKMQDKYTPEQIALFEMMMADMNTFLQEQEDQK